MTMDTTKPTDAELRRLIGSACVRQWREPLTLKSRAIRALKTLREKEYPRELWAARQTVIADALSAHTLATTGRLHLLNTIR